MSAQSPAPSDEPQAGNTGEIAYRFCQECSNLLYPREDRQLNKLLYICKACQSIQEHDSACTYRQNLSEAAQESMGEKAYVSNDPTLPHEARTCPMCQQNDVVYFQSQQRKGDIGMSLYYVCTNPNCNHAWSPVRDQNK